MGLAARAQDGARGPRPCREPRLVSRAAPARHRYSCCNGTAGSPNGMTIEGDCRPTRAYLQNDGIWRALVDGRLGAGAAARDAAAAGLAFFPSNLGLVLGLFFRLDSTCGIAGKLNAAAARRRAAWWPETGDSRQGVAWVSSGEDTMTDTADSRMGSHMVTVSPEIVVADKDLLQKAPSGSLPILPIWKSPEDPPRSSRGWFHPVLGTCRRGKSGLAFAVSPVDC